MKGEKKKSFEKNDGPRPLLSAGALLRHKLNQILDTKGKKNEKGKDEGRKDKAKTKDFDKEKGKHEDDET
ncbi:hypothetical protein LOK49_LG03G00517 [Camellia lanceoleosa]|uniref:Uncharacterized protein n=1 Tax=Camellia lanceoleosa TaxID=1840588 RepID=A0ACC0I9Y7_9ERIC|nr:hypothetical protein LOK49_LG03G00517 [Camellia lanceoleosa]